MSDDEADPELLELLRQSLGISNTRQEEVSSDTGILADAKFIYNNAIDVFIEMYGTKAAASSIYKAMQERGYSTEAWSQHELHPKSSEEFSDVEIVNFIFTMDLLNFSFWSELSESERYQVQYRGKRWTGYNSLVACLRRAIDEGVPITTPRFWREGQASDADLQHVFRSATDEAMPMLVERLALLREAAEVLQDSFADAEEEREQANRQGPVDTRVDNVTSIEHHSSADLAETEAVIAAVAEVEQESADTAELEKEEVGTGEAKMHDIHHSVTRPPQQDGETSTTQHDPLSGTAESGQREDAIAEAEHGESASLERATDLHPPAQPSLGPDHSVVRLLSQADHSAGKLVNLLAEHFACFRDETRFEGRKVRLLKRAQILVADLWAAFGKTGYGEFHDVERLTMFADYRVPQMLHSLGVISYSPPLDHHISSQQVLPSGHSWEVQLRGCSIYAVELIRQAIVNEHPEARDVNAVLIDFFLYDLAKEREVQVGFARAHHRTRSIWY